MKKYFIQTFWCSMNQADSEKINMILLQSWFFKVANWRQADLVILNTCSVRQKGEDRVFWFAEEIKKYNTENNKNILLGITGCMTRKSGLNNKYLEDYKRDKNKAKQIVTAKSENEILNNDDKLFPRFWEKLDFTLRIEDIKYLPLQLTHIFGEAIGQDYKFDDYLKQKQHRENPSQAIIIIQSGCDNMCSYCIVPQTRWRENSRTIEDIVSEANRVVSEWAKEITLVGQNVNSYWKEFIDKKFWNKEKAKWSSPQSSPKGEEAISFKTPFRKLLEELDKIEWLDRIRFTSSNPHDMTQDILDAHFDLKKTCNYLHFALQSWNDKMLKQMNRRHSYEDFKKMVNYLRSRDPNFSISTDIIVGYSNETEDMFNDTIKAYADCNFDFVFNARYSVRKGTIAEKIYPDNISEETKASRWHKLNDLLLESLTKRNNMMVWKIEEVLISWEKDWKFFGRTRNFKEVYFSPHLTSPKGEESKEIKIWDIVKVKILWLDKYILNWEIV